MAHASEIQKLRAESVCRPDRVPRGPIAHRHRAILIPFVDPCFEKPLQVHPGASPASTPTSSRVKWTDVHVADGRQVGKVLYYCTITNT
eukprot:591135-Prymnesium_polylepis.2